MRAFRTSVNDQWGILIPFRANSAATLIALGADEIVLGRQGELGPIDPIMNIQRSIPGPGGQRALIQESVSVEDVMAYVRFVRERAGLSDQDSLSVSLTKLTDRLDAISLGSAYRTHSHIRDVARRVLLSRKAQVPEQVLESIVDTLAERVYAHGHAIGLHAAQSIGLQAIEAPPKLELLMWDLLCDYEKELKLRSPLDPATCVQTKDKHTEDATIAILESSELIHRHTGTIEVTAKRQMPPQLNVAVNLNLQLPGNLNLASIPAGAQQALQQIIQAAQQPIVQQAQEAVQQALQQQAPLIGVEAAFRDAEWKEGS